MTIKAIIFLNESNLIEGITDIDYSLEPFQDPCKGHFGAYVLSQQMGVDQQCLSIKMIKLWHTLIGREQKDYTRDEISEEAIGHIRNPNLPVNVRVGRHRPPDYKLVPLCLMNFIEDFNEQLKRNIEVYSRNDHAFCEFVGSFFLKFEKIHPFADGNGRLGRILVNYITTFCRRPTIVFSSDITSRNNYIKAHESEEAMINFIADSIIGV